VKAENISLGIGYLSAYIKEKGHETELMDFTWGGRISDCIKKIKQTKPDIIGFSLRSGELSFCLELVDAIKNDFDIPVIFGGVHPTVDPEGTITQKNVDMICIGEGELALVELLDKMEAGEEIYSTPNFWFKLDGKIIKNPVHPLIQDLDELPHPDRELFNFNKYLKSNSNNVDILVGRGCPFNCTYCINHILQKIYRGKGKYVRMRSVRNVLEEIEYLTDKYDISTISFQDDTFTVKKEWVRQFSQQYSRKFNIPFTCNARVETMDREIANLLKDAGCTSVHMGVESGSEKIRKEVLRRKMSNEQIINAFKYVKEAGIKTYSYNMFGTPFETREDMDETLRINRIVAPDFLQVSIFQPYPGTELYELCKNKGWIQDETMPMTHKLSSVMKYPHITPNEIKRFKKLFRFRVLRKTDLKIAPVVLLFDLTLEYYVKFRAIIPTPIKRLMYGVLRSKT
jgi:radical SAM superfamily enzyme YgiQ (UPF0313 family)